MKRRDFIKTTTCLACTGAMSCNNLKADASVISDIKIKLAERKYIYKTEADLPTRIRLDICNMCQLNCAKCWVRDNEERIIKERGGFGYVSFDTFKTFIDKHPFIKEIELSNNGEVFLNPDLDKILEYSYEKGIRLTAWNGVNLNTLSEQTAENLVKYKFFGMSVSIDAATPETYVIYQRGGDFNTVINNIKMINKYKAKYHSDTPFMNYKMVLFGHNEDEIEDAKKLAKELDMNMKYDVNYFDDYSPLKNKEKVLEQTGLKAFETCASIADYKEDKTKYIVCKEIYECPQINWNGDLYGCCGLHLNGDFNVNVFKVGLLKAMNCATMLYSKYLLSDISIEPKKYTPCKVCYIYGNLKKDNVSFSMN